MCLALPARVVELLPNLRAMVDPEEAQRTLALFAELSEVQNTSQSSHTMREAL